MNFKVLKSYFSGKPVNMLLNHVGYSVIYQVDYSAGVTQPADFQLSSPKQSFQAFKLQTMLAQSVTQPATQSTPQSARDFYDSGVEAQSSGQVDAAIQAYQQAIALESTFDAAYINLGLAFIQLGQFENAQNTFQQVLTLPDRTERPASIHTLAHYNLAIILHRQGKTEEAIVEVQQALVITPDFDKAQQLLQQLQDLRAGLTHFFS